jgi:hypothetical protein
LGRFFAFGDEKGAKPNKPDVFKVMKLNGKLNFHSLGICVVVAKN